MSVPPSRLSSGSVRRPRHDDGPCARRADAVVPPSLPAWRWPASPSVRRAPPAAGDVPTGWRHAPRCDGVASRHGPYGATTVPALQSPPRRRRTCRQTGRHRWERRRRLFRQPPRRVRRGGVRHGRADGPGTPPRNVPSPPHVHDVRPRPRATRGAPSHVPRAGKAARRPTRRRHLSRCPEVRSNPRARSCPDG